MSIVIGGTFSYLRPSIGIPFLMILFCISCLSLWKAYSRQSITIPVLLVALCGIAVSVGQSYLSEPKQLNFAMPDALISPVLQGLTIRIGNLAREDNVIRNRTFDNCQIYGPSVILPSGCTFIKCLFDTSNRDSIFIITTNKTIANATVFEFCIFKNCVFHKMSFIGPSELIEDLKSKISNENDVNKK